MFSGIRKRFLSLILLSTFMLSATPSLSQEPGFTREDRERLIRVETTLKVFMDQVDKRFIELREDMNKRFEVMDKRFMELREDMNKRFELMDKRFEQVDKRFEQVDKRFEQVDKRFEQMMNFLWMLVAIFTTITGTALGLAYWDRRTIIRKARDEAIETIEKEGRLRDLIKALRKLAAEDMRVAEVLRSFGLL